MSIPSFHKQDSAFSLASEQNSTSKDIKEKVKSYNEESKSEKINKRRLSLFRAPSKHQNKKKTASIFSTTVATPEMIRPSHQLMSNIITLESKSREMEKKLKSKGAKIEQLKKK